MLVVFLSLALLQGCGNEHLADDKTGVPRSAEPARIVTAQEIVSSTQVSTLDPGILHGAEIRKAIGDGRLCTFHYTSTGKAVAAVRRESDGSASDGVIKLRGRLVKLANRPTESGSRSASPIALEATPILLTITPDKEDGAADGRREANMVFQVGDELKAGYRGYFSCPSTTGEATG